MLLTVLSEQLKIMVDNIFYNAAILPHINHRRGGFVFVYGYRICLVHITLYVFNSVHYYSCIIDGSGFAFLGCRVVATCCGYHFTYLQEKDYLG